jgi:rubrerythrin
MSQATRYLVQEVHNFGGFFGGDTVTLTATPFGATAVPADQEQTITIDQQALANVRDRHTISAGMLLDLSRTGERVDRAELLGAATHTQLRAALGAPAATAPLAEPLILSYACRICNLWVAGAPEQGRCRLCGSILQDEETFEK